MSKRAIVALVAAAAALCCLAGGAPLAGAATVSEERPFLFNFDGAETGSVFSGPSSLAVDNATGALYVADRGRLCKFHPDGTPWNFSSVGEGCITGGGGAQLGIRVRVAVDNSPAHPGRVYVAAHEILAFEPDGTFLWKLNPVRFAADVAVGPDGKLWLIRQAGNLVEEVMRYASSGSPPALETVSTLPPEPVGSPGDIIEVDASGNCYVRSFEGEFKRYTGCDFESTSTLIDSFAHDFYADQSTPTGHLFTLARATPGNIEEYDSGGSLLGTYAESGEYLVRKGNGFEGTVAYNPTLDRVYVAQGEQEPRPKVAAFGPKASGTVPDATTAAPSEVKVSCATFEGEVNPQGIASAWQFEWKASDETWASASRSPLESLPEDTLDHAVSYDTCALRGGTEFEVRLVGVADATDLRGNATAMSFTTEIPDPPSATIDPPAPATTSAHLTGEIDPMEDEVAWQVETTRDASCSAGWSVASPLPPPIPFDEVLGPKPVEYDITGLLPSERYCVRVKATNGGGSAFSNVVEVETLEVPPAAASTAFVAPRLDTGVRLNARVNPQGAPLEFGFEYSDDGGSTWTATPSAEDAIEAREPVVVGMQLEGLDPGTDYDFRLAFAENDAGSATGLPGSARPFATRTEAEVRLPQPRGVELVNNPDKGNQNVVTNGNSPALAATVAPDGDAAIWGVYGAAPGGHTPAEATFLARRGADGWHSTSLVLPASQQYGGGGFRYKTKAATRDLTEVVSTTTSEDAFSTGNGAVVQIGEDGDERVLDEFEAAEGESNLDPTAHEAAELSEDGDHVVVGYRPESGQIEDIGSFGPHEVLSIMPGGAPSECLREEAGSFGGGGRAASISYRPGYRRATASDADRVYFEVPPNGSCSGKYGLYQRNRDTETTTLIDPGVTGHDPELIRVTPDGRAAYFATYSDLDPAHDGDETGDVYRWEEGGGSPTCLTCAENDRGEPVASAEVTMGSTGEGDPHGKAALVSDDFSHVYFHSAAQLIPGEGRAGDPNIYVLREGKIGFVADTGDSTTGFILNRAYAKLSGDGDVLAFSMLAGKSPARTLTADPMAAQCPVLGVSEPEPCRQLYVYDDDARSLECVSCSRVGETTKTWGNNRTGNNAEIEGGFDLSADGSTVLFVTQQPLVAADVNDALDVYEWRDGVQRLISDGTTAFGDDTASQPKVAGLDATGANAFFSLTAPQLTGFERDGVANLYDARIGGGFEPPSPPQECEGEACAGPAQAPPAPVQTGSFGHGRGGNVAPSPDCGELAHRAGRLIRHSRAARHRAGRLRGHARGRKLGPKARGKLRKRAHRLSRRGRRWQKKARGLRRRAKRCRAAASGGGSK